MKIYFKTFIIFAIVLLVFAVFFLFTLYQKKEYIKTNVEQDKVEALATLMQSIINTYKDTCTVIDSRAINIIAKKNSEIINKDLSKIIGYKVYVRNISEIKNKEELEIISFFEKNPYKNIYYQKIKNGSLYAKPIYFPKEELKNINNNLNYFKTSDLIGVIIIKTMKNGIAVVADDSFKKVMIYSILFFIIILVVIFILLKRLLQKENEFTKKLQEEVKNKTQELKASNKELVNTNIELIKLNKEYLVQNEELSSKKEQLKQKVEELTFTKEELEKRNKTILKREAELIKSQKELIDFNEEYQKQNDEYSLLIKKYIELNDDLIKQNRNLEIAEYKAKEANNFKSEFLANMSHEIRTPMNAILGFSEILNSRIKDSGNKVFIKNIITSGNVLINLINDILDLSKIEAGQLKISKENVNLFETINNIPNMFSDFSKKKNIPIDINIKNNVPKYIISDGLRLNQIMINLVGNALKFTEKGNICINIDAVKKAKYIFDISIEVTDTGIGIPTEQLFSIFDIFKQVDGQSTRKYGGTGLGLSITKRLVKMLGGKIHVNSKVGQGTSFSILLKDVEATRDFEIETNNDNIAILITDRVKILHAEDNDMNRQIVSLFSEEYNFELNEVTDGIQVIEQLKTYTPDIILMDIQMPNQDGFETAKIIRKDKALQNIPIIALTANATSEEKKKYSSVFNSYLTKPITKNDFIKSISKYIKIR